MDAPQLHGWLCYCGIEMPSLGRLSPALSPLSFTPAWVYSWIGGGHSGGIVLVTLNSPIVSSCDVIAATRPWDVKAEQRRAHNAV